MAYFSIITRYAAFIWLAFLSSLLAAQPMDSGTRAAGLAGATVALGDLLSIRPNPAAIADANTFAVTLFASRGFNLPALKLGSAGFVAPLSFVTVGVDAQTLGDELFRETDLRLGFARALKLGSSRSIYTGVSGTVRSTSIRDYGNRTALALSFGTLVEIWPALFWGFAYENLAQSNSPSRLPERMHIGLAFNSMLPTQILASVAKERDFPISARVGLEHRIGKILRLQTGFATQPNRVAAGLEILLKWIAVGIAGERHEFLGWTPGISANLFLTSPSAHR